MKKLQLISLSTIFFLLLFSMACNKEENPEPQPQNDTAELDVKSAEIPAAMMQSNDPGAIQARSGMNMVNGMTAYGDMMKPPKKSSPLNHKNGEPEIITWNIDDGTGQNNYNVTLKVTETTLYYTWEMILDGIFEGQHLSNYTFIQAKAYLDGSLNEIIVNDIDNIGGVFMKMSWYENEGTIYFTFEVPQEVLINMVVHADGSGTIEEKEWENGQYVLTFRAEWDATGHGNYWEYDGGVLSHQGKW